MSRSDDQRFLIVRLAGIGDVVMASALARRLRDAHPGARITWLCGTTAAPLVQRLADVDDVVAIDERALLTGGSLARARVLLPLWRQLRAARFTRVYLLHPDPRYRVITAPLVGIPVVAQSRREHGAMNPIPGRYMADEFARLMDGPEHRGPIIGHFPLGRLEPLGPAAGDAPSTVPGDASSNAPRSAPSAKRIALVPGGARNVLRESALKRWPVEHYAALARALSADGHEIVLAGNTADDWARPHFAGIAVTDLIGRTSLPDMMSVLSSCALVVSHDTGPMHLARLVGAPLIALFGPTNPSHFTVADERTTVLWGGEHLACRPCYDGREFADCRDNQCISSIGVDVVLRTARTILARRSEATPAPPSRQTPGETALR